jgi:hypothetical protein
MEIGVLNSKFEQIFVLDSFLSAIWVDRYSSCGEFEIRFSSSDPIGKAIKPGYYLTTSKSESIMIVETIQRSDSPENGRIRIISGRSLESILSRRIVWNQTELKGHLRTELFRLITENAVEPVNTNRIIDNLVLVPDTNAAITGMEIDEQYWGDELLSIITSICTEKKIGFKLRLGDGNLFEFFLYNGVDRTYAQTDRPCVVFSAGFDNLTSSTFFSTKSAYKSIALVVGEGVGTDRISVVVTGPRGIGNNLSRRELYLDAGDLTSNTEPPLNQEEYLEKLKSRGKKRLEKLSTLETLDGDIDTSVSPFKYGENFKMGDIVQIEDEDGGKGTARVIEWIINCDKDGESAMPTFSTITDEDDEE